MREQRYWFPKPYADFVQRLRVPCGFLLLVMLAWLSHPGWQSMATGLPVSILGLALRAWATGHLTKDRHLTTSGPYAYIRNPLYAGTLIVATGLVIASRDTVLAGIFAAVFCFVYLPTIELEEQHLRAKFPAYAAYAQDIPRLLPVRRWTARGSSGAWSTQARNCQAAAQSLPGSFLENECKPFSWTLYRHNREHKALLGFLLAVAWLVGKCVFTGVIRFRR